MDKIRPFQIVVLTVFVVAAIGGVYFFSTFSGFGGKKVSYGTVVIWGTLPKSAIESAIATENETNKAFATVSYVEIPASSFHTAFTDALASGGGPDLIILSSEDLNVEKSKLQLISYESISQRSYVDSFLPLFEIFLSENGTYGLPLVIDPLVLYYNRSSLASASVARPPSTWEAVAGLSGSLSSHDASGTIYKSLIPLGGYANVRNARAILSLLLLQSGSSITETTPQGTMSTLGAENSSMTFGSTPASAAVNFYTQFADPSKTVYSWNRSLSDSRQAFLAGDLALYPGFSSELTYLKNANPNLDFDMAPVPQPGTGQTKRNYGVGYAFTIPKQSKNPAGAFSVASVLVGNAPMMQIAQALTMTPAKRALQSPPKDDKYAPIYFPAGLIASSWLSPAPSVVDGIFAGMISNITSGRMNTTQALQSADESINASLR